MLPPPGAKGARGRAALPANVRCPLPARPAHLTLYLAPQGAQGKRAGKGSAASRRRRVSQQGALQRCAWESAPPTDTRTHTHTRTRVYTRTITNTSPSGCACYRALACNGCPHASPHPVRVRAPHVTQLIKYKDELSTAFFRVLVPLIGAGFISRSRVPELQGAISLP